MHAQGINTVHLLMLAKLCVLHMCAGRTAWPPKHTYVRLLFASDSQLRIDAFVPQDCGWPRCTRAMDASFLRYNHPLMNKFRQCLQEWKEKVYWIEVRTVFNVNLDLKIPHHHGPLVIF